MRSVFALGVLGCCISIACSDSESTGKTGAGSGGTGGTSTGGTSTGSTAGQGGTPADASVDASGGSAGTATGGTAGAATGGTAGTATGGTAGTATGGTAGAATGGAAGSEGCALPPLGSTTTPGNAAVYYLARTGPVDPYDLYRLDVSGLTVGLSALIPTSFHVFHAAASPDGKRLALEAYTSVPYANPDLYVMDVQPGSTHVHCLVPKPPGASQAVGFSWSPNGKRILFENALPSSDEGPVSVTDLTSPITSWQLSPQGNIGLVEGWTHDARFVAFRSGTDLLVTDLNAGPPFTPQTIATDTTFEAAFIPNTHTLVYISGGLLFARNFDTTGSAVQLTSTPSVAKWISLSADGTRLAWASDVTGTTNLASQLFMLEVVNGLPTGTPVPVFPSSVNYDNIQEVQWAPGSNRLIAIAELSLVQSGLYFVDATVFPPSFHAVAAPSGSESAREPQWSSNGKLVTYLFGVAAQLYLSDLSQATPGAPQSIAAPLIQAGPRFSPAGDLISLRTYGKVNIANTANFSQGLTVVSPTPVPSIIPGASTMRWSPSGVLFFLGNYQSSKVISLHAWKGSGLATVVSPPSVYEVRDYLFVPQ